MLSKAGNYVLKRQQARFFSIVLFSITAAALLGVGLNSPRPSIIPQASDSKDPIVGIAQLPASIGAVCVLEDAANLRATESGGTIIGALVDTGLLAKSVRSWEELAEGLNWTPGEAFDELFGRRVVIAFDELSQEWGTPWIVLADVDESTEARIRKKLKLVPRDIANKTRILAGERGRFRLAVIPGDERSSVSTLLIAPVDHKSFFFRTLEAITDPNAELKRLGDTPGYRELQKLERRSVRIVVQRSENAENSSQFFALSAKRVGADWIAHWSGSLDLLGITPDAAVELHPWPWRAFDRISEEAIIAVMGVAGRIDSNVLGSLGQFTTSLLNIGSTAVFPDTGPVQMAAIHRTTPSSATDADDEQAPHIGLTLATQWGGNSSAADIDSAIGKFITSISSKPSKTKNDLKGEFPGAVRSVQVSACEESQFGWIHAADEGINVSWSHTKQEDSASSDAWSVVQIAGGHTIKTPVTRLNDVAKALTHQWSDQLVSRRISMGVMKPRELIDWLTSLGMDQTGELAMFRDIKKLRWDAWITDDGFIEGQARMTLYPKN